MIHLILGGRRSGKSRRGEELALDLAEDPVYLATSRKWDEDFARRIEAHVQSRSGRWVTIEEERRLSRDDLSGRTVLVECITMWLTNLFTDLAFDEAKALDEARRELDKLFPIPHHIVFVSSETGLGLHPETDGGRKFADLQGEVNHYIAARADHVELVVAGLPLVIRHGIGTHGSSLPGKRAVEP